ncbi:hypothetical protein CDV26_11230 [Francisella halioticida]|uniref:Uncharacterized protein n=1 Tax=Francisella halioticida TaxID=549298 RepID=A0ABM6M1M5_9GAMM|nr:hypothetical protein [Francisella halioticida]ASG68870.1 hypothetical protein CDV26_11230 [Francisella halioticida]
MKCPFKESESCSKKNGLYALAMFLTVLGVAVALKIITLILCIFPGSIHENTWLVVISIVLVLFAAKCRKSGHCCGLESNNSSCTKKESDKECCNKDEETKDGSQN